MVSEKIKTAATDEDFKKAMFEQWEKMNRHDRRAQVAKLRKLSRKMKRRKNERPD